MNWPVIPFLRRLAAVFRVVRNRAAAVIVLGLTLFRVEAAPGPIRVSENGRYFVDAQAAPFYFLADTRGNSSAAIL